MFSKFIETAKIVKKCQYGMYDYVFEQYPYVMIFKTTNYCWYNCVHCCENAGTRNQKKFMPKPVITNIIDQAIKDKSFSRIVVFTGGELMSAYKFADKNYVPNLINHALDAGCVVDIKTNAAWINFPLANQIFNDIENIAQKHANVNDNSNEKTFIDFQVSLSLDRFHKNALNNDLEFIKHFAHTDIPGVEFHIHINSFEQDRYMFYELIQKLVESGITIRELPGFNSGKTVFFMCNLDNNVAVNYSETKLFYGGRAKNMKSVNKPLAQEFDFISNDTESLVAFDSFGNVTLGENFDGNIATSWYDGKAVKPLETIKSELSNNIRQAEQNFLQQHQVLNKCFNLARKFSVK